jgi:hypothetical protein
LGADELEALESIVFDLANLQESGVIFRLETAKHHLSGGKVAEIENRLFVDRW